MVSQPERESRSYRAETRRCSKRACCERLLGLRALDKAVLKRAGIILLLGLPFAAGPIFELPLCPSASLFSVPCPGCGLTRATVALLHGDVLAAWSLHPLVFLLSPVYFGLLGLIAYSYVRGSPPAILQGAGISGRSFLLGRSVSILAGLTLTLAFAVWIARFFGAFGGPVPVETWNEWRARHVVERR